MTPAKTIEYKIKNIIQDLLDKHSSYDSYFEEIGYKITGPIYLGYVCWLIKNATDKNISHLYFLSRDGINPYLLYQKLSKYLDFKLQPASYLYASRRAMLIPAIDTLNEESSELRFLISSWWEELKVKEFLFRLKIDLSSEEANCLIEKVGFTSMEYRVKRSDYTRLEKLFLEAAELIIRRGEKERKTLREYIIQEGLLAERHPAIVDIGWGGSMQKSIFKIIEKEKGSATKLDGFYVGTNNRMKSVRDLGIGADGFILQSYPEELSLYTIWQSTEILEFMFSADHPTVLYFEEAKEGIRPKFSMYNNEELYRESAEKVQTAAFKFVNDFLDLISKEGLEEYIKISDIDSDFYFKNLFNLVLNPTIRDAEHFHMIRHLPGLGETYEGDHIVEYCNSYSPKALCYRFEHAYWENGFLVTLSNAQKFLLLLFCKKYQERRRMRKKIKKLMNQKHPKWNF